MTGVQAARPLAGQRNRDRHRTVPVPGSSAGFTESCAGLGMARKRTLGFSASKADGLAIVLFLRHRVSSLPRTIPPPRVRDRAKRTQTRRDGDCETKPTGLSGRQRRCKSLRNRFEEPNFLANLMTQEELSIFSPHAVPSAPDLCETNRTPARDSCETNPNPDRPKRTGRETAVLVRRDLDVGEQ